MNSLGNTQILLQLFPRALFNITSFLSCHPIIFDVLNGHLINLSHQCPTLRGLLGLWELMLWGRGVCVHHFWTKSSDLCCTLASVIRHISGSHGDQGTKGVLLVDASNSFDYFNHRPAFLIIFQLCSPLATILTNTYCSASYLFIDLYCQCMLLVLSCYPTSDRMARYADDTSAGGSLL